MLMGCASSVAGQVAHYKIFRYIKFIESFPTMVTGKVQKFAMRNAMGAELGVLMLPPS